METVIVLAIVAAILWSSWRFWSSGKYKADRPDPDLTQFRPDNSTEEE